MKLYETNIKTENVYINILDGELVHTKTLSKEKAIEEYKYFDVVSFEEDIKSEGNLDTGITNIVLCRSEVENI